MADNGLDTGEEGKKASLRRLGDWIRGVGEQQYPSLYPGIDVSRENILRHGTLGLQHPDVKYLRDTSHYLELPGTLLDPYQFTTLRYEDQPAWMQHDNDLLAKKIGRYSTQHNYRGAVKGWEEVHASRQGMIGQADWLAFRDEQIRKLRGFTGDQDVLGITTANPLFQENSDTLINSANQVYRLDAERRNLENSPNYWEPRMVEDPLNDWARQEGLEVNPDPVLRHFATPRLENMRARIGAEQSRILNATGPSGWESMHSNLQEYLAKLGLNKPKTNLSGRLLSGVPLQFLDDMSDKAAFNMKRQAQLQSENIKMFQSRYANDAPYRASVNQGIKAKAPGILAAGVGGYIVKEKMKEGASLPAAVAQTAGEGLIAGAKFKFWDRFLGPVADLNAGETEWLDKNKPPISKEAQAYIDKQVGDEIRNGIASGSLTEQQKFQIKRVNSQVAKIEKEKQTLVELKQAQAEQVSDHIQRSMSASPLWNESNGYDKRISPAGLEPIAPDKRPSPSNLRNIGYTPL